MKILSYFKLTLVASVCGLSALSAATTEQPNILFIFADDLSYETIRAQGHLDIDTPNLDRLVAEGTTFTHAYNMGSWTGAVCMASRRGPPSSSLQGITHIEQRLQRVQLRCRVGK